MCSPEVQEIKSIFFVFSHKTPWWPNQESYATTIRSPSRGHPGVYVYEVWSQVSAVTKRAILDWGQWRWWTFMWPWKIGQIKSPENMWCLLARSTSNKNLSEIRAVLRELWHFFYFHITTPGGQTGNHMRPRFGLWVAVTQGYMYTKFKFNSFSGYETCHQCLTPTTDDALSQRLTGEPKMLSKQNTQQWLNDNKLK